MYRDEDRVARDEIPRDEMLLDVCLEEVLGGQAPPDLRGRILAAMEQAATGDAAPLTEPPLAEPPLVSPPPVSPPVQAGPQPATNGQAAAPIHLSQKTTSTLRTHRRGVERRWLPMAAAASLLIAALGMGLLAWQWAQPPGTSNVTQVDDGGIVGGAKDSREQPSVVENRNARDRDAQRRQPAANPFRETLFGAGFPPLPEESPVPWPLPYSVERQRDNDVVRFVNEHLARSRRGGAILDDDAWCRRVFGQILGREPTSEELVDFATSDSHQKREKLVDQLLSDNAYREEYAQHWASVWSVALLGPDVGDHENNMARRAGLQAYLAAALREGRPHDALAEQLIAATGSSRPGDAEFNGATNFVLASADDKEKSIDGAALAATVSRVFLGHQGQCAQCHDHLRRDNRRDRLRHRPHDGLSQQQFWQLAAFFQQAAPQRAGEEGAMRLANADFVSRSGDVAEAELYFDTPDKQRKIAYPVFIDGTPINPDGRVEVVDRRKELAALVVNSEEFSAATVKHYWRALLGESMQESSNVLAREQLVQGLSEQFAAHGFDQRQLLRWIVLSDANARPMAGDAAPLYDNVASALQDVGRQGRPVEARDSVLFARLARTDGGDVNDASIFVRDAGDRSNDFVRRISASDMALAAKVEHVFLHTLARQPTTGEMSAARRMLAARDGQMADALDDIAWAITRSAEYAAR